MSAAALHSEVRIQSADFDVGSEWAACCRRCAGKAGAVAAFGGLVRDRSAGNGGESSQGEQVTGLYLEHYPGMTESSIDAIIGEASRRWRLLDVLVVHRVGDLAPQDPIVLVLVASGHRPDAFAACEFIMDYLKTDAVFWKKERRRNGSIWIRATDDDHQRRTGWKEPA